MDEVIFNIWAVHTDGKWYNYACIKRNDELIYYCSGEEVKKVTVRADDNNEPPQHYWKMS